MATMWRVVLVFVVNITAALGMCFAAFADTDAGLVAYKAGDFPKAFSEWQASAFEGDAAAQFNLSQLYFQGQGTPQDLAKGADWLIKSAEQRFVDAQFNLGNNYAAGTQGLPQDLAKAVEWLGKAANQGDASAQYNLGLLHSKKEQIKNEERASFWFGKAAAQDHTNAMVSLGVIHYNGEGVVRDKARALELYQQAYALDNPAAARLIGDMYESGTHIAADNAKAMSHYRQAARGGDYEAHMITAFRYRDGLIVEKDLVLGYVYATLGLSLALQNVEYYGSEIPAIEDFQRSVWSKLSEEQREECLKLFTSATPGVQLPERSLTWKN